MRVRRGRRDEHSDVGDDVLVQQVLCDDTAGITLVDLDDDVLLALPGEVSRRQVRRPASGRAAIPQPDGQHQPWDRDPAAAMVALSLRGCRAGAPTTCGAARSGCTSSGIVTLFASWPHCGVGRASLAGLPRRRPGRSSPAVRGHAIPAWRRDARPRRWSGARRPDGPAPG